MNASLTALTGAAAVTSSLLFVWPQVVRLVRTRDTQGISVTSALWAMAGFSLWSAYGLRRSLPAIWIANGQALVGFAVILVLCSRWGAPIRRLWLLAAIEATVLVLFAATMPAAVVGVAAITIGATSFVPQAVVAWRADDVTGVSVATYVLLAVSGSLWMLYGVLRRDPLVVAPNLLIVPTAVLVAARAAGRRRVLTGAFAADEVS